MEKVKKEYALRWLNYLLLVVNITALTVILLSNKSVDNEGSLVDKRISSLEFLRNELNLNDEQYKEIGKLDDNVFRAYHILVDLICETNFGILEELSHEEPSVEVLDSLARKYGNLNTALRKQTNKHFLNIISVCDSTQKEKLSILFKDMMEMDEYCKLCNKKECIRRDRLEQMKK